MAARVVVFSYKTSCYLVLRCTKLAPPIEASRIGLVESRQSKWPAHPSSHDLRKHDLMMTHHSSHYKFTQKLNMNNRLFGAVSEL